MTRPQAEDAHRAPKPRSWAGATRTSRRALLAGAALMVPAACSSDHGDDVVSSSAVSGLEGFISWARAHSVSAEIGETGWPGTDPWNRLATRYLQRARELDADVFAFAAAPWWQATDPLAFYRSATHRSLDTVGRQAAPLEQAAHDNQAVGIALAEPTFGLDVGDTGTYSSSNPGAAGTTYSWPSLDSLEFLASRGLRRVRLCVAWERLQRSPWAPLQAQELQLLKASLTAASRAGLKVVVDLHNYGRYAGFRDGRRQVWRLGSAQLPASALADVWKQLATALADEDAVSGYDVMNEPHDLPDGAAGWEDASRRAVAAIRTVDRTRRVHVEGYAWSAASSFATHHPAPWIDDPLVSYSAHQYFDPDGSGVYAQSYDEAVRAMSASRH